MNRLKAQPLFPSAPANSQPDSKSLDSPDQSQALEWDAFLATHPSGQHVQSSLWAQVKSLNDWRCRRITVSDGTDIVGGAQILIKQVRLFGSVGYVPQGPLLLKGHEPLAPRLLAQIRDAAREERLKVLFVQPPEEGAIAAALSANKFYSCPIETAPTATLLVDLTDDFDTILSRMPKGMRNQMRRSQNRGIRVHEGERSELPVFHRLLSATSERHGFTTFDLEYFYGMWDILSPTGNIKLFIASLDGEPVSAQFCIPFGDRLVAKQIGWTGANGRRHPNEALDWFTMQWAQDRGYHYYDLEGIERSAAEALINDRPLPEQFAGTPTAYKVRLGGRARIGPGSFCFIANPIFRSLYRVAGYPIASTSVVQNAAGRFRTG